MKSRFDTPQKSERILDKLNTLKSIQQLLSKSEDLSKKDLSDVRRQLGYFDDSELKAKLDRLDQSLPNNQAELDQQLAREDKETIVKAVIDILVPFAGIFINSTSDELLERYRLLRKELNAYRELKKLYAESIVQKWSERQFESRLILMMQYQELLSEEEILQEASVKTNIQAISPEGAPIPIPVSVGEIDD